MGFAMPSVKTTMMAVPHKTDILVFEAHSGVAFIGCWDRVGPYRETVHVGESTRERLGPNLRPLRSQLGPEPATIAAHTNSP
jgi:hypothetical protein